MSVSLKSVPNIEKILKQKDTFILENQNIKLSKEKQRKCKSSKNIFYQQENPKQKPNKNTINRDLCILNLISMKSIERKSSEKTTLSDIIPEKFNYNVCMINKYDENLNSSLSFISEFDLEEEDDSFQDSFSSSNNDENCDEQIEIKTSTKSLNVNDEEEDNKKLEKEWNDIKELLLGKE